MHCEICKRKLDLRAKLKTFNLLKCKVCDHVVTDLVVDNKYYIETYSKEYVDDKHKNWMNNPNFALFEKINLFIKKKGKGRILDLGCGTGMLLKFLNKKNPKYDLTGIDIISNKKIKNIKFIKKEFFNYLPSSKFSYIISIAVIEHVPKVKKYLDYLRKISNKNAYFIVLTINTNSILYKSAELLYTFGIKTPFVRLFDPHHLNHFSNKSLNKFLDKNGYVMVEKINTPISMKQIDYPYNNILTKYILFIGLFCMLKIEKILNKSWLQTVIFRKK